MQVTSQIFDDTLVVFLNGELDEHSATYVREVMDDIFTQSRAKHIIIDLEQLDFMDSTGIGVMIGRYKKMKSRGVPMFVRNPNKQIDKIFAMTALYDVMPKID